MHLLFRQHFCLNTLSILISRTTPNSQYFILKHVYAITGSNQKCAQGMYHFSDGGIECTVGGLHSWLSRESSRQRGEMGVLSMNQQVKSRLSVFRGHQGHGSPQLCQRGRQEWQASSHELCLHYLHLSEPGSTLHACHTCMTLLMLSSWYCCMILNNWGMLQISTAVCRCCCTLVRAYLKSKSRKVVMQISKNPAWEQPMSTVCCVVQIRR